MTRNLHIVCFDVPFPVSHGGYFDLFYKLQALKQIGISIHLHCFEYGRGQQKELEKYCASVDYYPRKKWTGISLSLPFIVSSRVSKELVLRLSQDSYPILLEGTHSTHILYSNIFPGRKILYRLHNIEQIYYYHLQRSETSIFRRTYFGLEAGLLRKYEKKIAARASAVLAVSEKDQVAYQQLFPTATVHYLPLFHPYDKPKCRPGKGKFILYHGNLSVPENEKAALFLAETLSNTGIPFIVAGRKPSAQLANALKKNTNARLVSDPSDEEMEELVRSAHINIVYSLNGTGIKIKLLHALYSGRHTIVNEAAVPGNAFREFSYVADTEKEIIEKAHQLMQADFTVAEAQKRAAFLQQHYNLEKNASMLNAFLL